MTKLLYLRTIDGDLYQVEEGAKFDGDYVSAKRVWDGMTAQVRTKHIVAVLYPKGAHVPSALHKGG
jgi:hypothetical protein